MIVCVIFISIIRSSIIILSNFINFKLDNKPQLHLLNADSYLHPKSGYLFQRGYSSQNKNKSDLWSNYQQ